MTPEEIAARQLDVLGRFVIRARRLAAHSLNAWEHLSLVHTGGFEATARIGKPLTVTTYLPDEEQLESAAARARPLFLKGDPIHYGKVLSALGYFAQADPEVLAKIQRCKEYWQHTEDPIRNYYVHPSEDRPAMTDKVLFESWLYGDLIHAGKEDQAAAAGTTLQERFEAAVTMITSVFVITATTLRLLEECQAAGLFRVPKQAFTEVVSAHTGPIEQHQILYIDAPGTTAPEAARETSRYREWRTGIFVHPDAWESWVSVAQSDRESPEGMTG